MDGTGVVNAKRSATFPASRETKNPKKVTVQFGNGGCIRMYMVLRTATPKISVEACSVLNSIISNVAILCSLRLQVLPVALKYYDSQSYVDTKVQFIEQSFSKIHSIEIQLTKTVDKVQSQLMSVMNLWQLCLKV